MTMPVTVQLDATLVRVVDKIAKEIGKTREEFIEEALECEVGERELVHIAESRAREIREGRERSFEGRKRAKTSRESSFEGRNAPRQAAKVLLKAETRRGKPRKFF
ncbi:MAG: ribbon-helix-helix protein, CopG family [Treponema sp.]|nr:ribbon-helix-helix protein, CopG family [Treponema sp.]